MAQAAAPDLTHRRPGTGAAGDGRRRRRRQRTNGFDATAPLLEIARERAPNGEFALGDLESLPYGDDAFVGFNSFQYPTITA